jgi:hypothetical protein
MALEPGVAAAEQIYVPISQCYVYRVVALTPFYVNVLSVQTFSVNVALCTDILCKIAHSYPVQGMHSVQTDFLLWRTVQTSAPPPFATKPL